MMKRKIKLLSILLTVMLALTAALPALGETLTVHYLQDESIPAEQRFTFGQENVTLSAYLVATGPYGAWEPLEAYSDIQFFDANGGFLKNCMAEVRTRIAERNINPVATAITRAADGINGVAEFAVVNDGMYFVIQSGSQVIDDDRTIRVVRTSDMMLATNGADDVDAKWIYTITPDHPYKLTIIYVDEHNDRIDQVGKNGQPTKEDYVEILWEGAKYYVPSPAWYGHAEGTYTISIRIVQGVMPAHDVVIYVVYIPIRRGTHEIIEEYETALGLGNIQMHVGVCFE